MLKTMAVQIIKCEFRAEGSSESSLISEMSSDFVWNSVFWLCKLQRVNSVNEFPKLSPQSFTILERLIFISFSSSIVVKIETSSKKM